MEDSKPMKIVRILNVVDTRQYEEGENDRFFPIPGSGQANDCFCCGRSHEVHATVLLEDNSQAVVGTGCASRSDTERAARYGSADSLAKRLASLNAEEARYDEKLAAWD